MSDQIVAQCMDCGHKQEISVKAESPRGKCQECGGPTTQYTSRMLSPEDLARYGPAVPSKGKKPSFASLASSEEQSRRAKIRYDQEAKEQPKPIEELDTMKNNKITKADYLKLRSMGMTRKEVARKYGYAVSHLENYWLKQWLIKDPLEEDLELVKYAQSSKEQPQGLNAINAAHQEEMVKIDPPVKVVEAVVLEEVIQEEQVAVEPEPVAAAPDIDPEPEPVVEEPVKIYLDSKEIAEIKVVPKTPLKFQYEPPAVVKEFTRAFTIKTSGDRGEVEEELAALLGYVQSMRGNKEFQLELYLGEVKVG